MKKLFKHLLIAVLTMISIDSMGQSKTGPGSSEWHIVGDAGEPAFNATWSNIGTIYNDAEFRLTIPNSVELRGVVKTSGGGTPIIFTLPVGFRPLKAVLLPTLVDDGLGNLKAATVIVAVDGKVVVAAPGLPSGYTVTLDNLRSPLN